MLAVRYKAQRDLPSLACFHDIQPAIHTRISKKKIKHRDTSITYVYTKGHTEKGTKKSRGEAVDEGGRESAADQAVCAPATAKGPNGRVNTLLTLRGESERHESQMEFGSVI